jgi:hypothetical protein
MTTRQDCSGCNPPNTGVPPFGQHGRRRRRAVIASSTFTLVPWLHSAPGGHDVGNTPDPDGRVWQLVGMGLDLRTFAIRCNLIGVARSKDTALPTYGDLHTIFGGGNQNQGRFLELTYEDCRIHNEPDGTQQRGGEK